MVDDNYRQALEAASREYESLAAERARIDDRMAQLHETISSLMRLCGYEPAVPWGLTEACRAVLLRAREPLTPVEVRERLRALGFDLARYANELAAIHTTLKRLAEAGEAKRTTNAAGDAVYAAVRVRAMRREDVEKLLKGDALARLIPSDFLGSRKKAK